MFIITVLFVPVAFLIWNSEHILTQAGIEPVAAHHASEYLIYMLPAIYLNCIGDSITLFLAGMGYTYGIVALQAVMIPIHVFCCWFFVSYQQMGIIGTS